MRTYFELFPWFLSAGDGHHGCAPDRCYPGVRTRKRLQLDAERHVVPAAPPPQHPRGGALPRPTQRPQHPHLHLKYPLSSDVVQLV